ncbi:RICIN domain-containing protein [Sorangium sp. So ce1153]
MFKTTDKALDVNLALTANNSPPSIRTCDGEPNQRWTRM